MADVFISYKKEDWERADRIAAALRDDGFSVWWDEHLTPQNEWDATIERELAAASVVVVLWTARSTQSDWVRREAHYGQDRGKLVPVLLDDCAIPLAFTLRQTVRLTGWQGARGDREWRKFLTWIADLVATKPGNANLPQALTAAQPNRYREAIGHLASGDAIVDGAFVNASTPAGTAFRDGPQFPVMRIVPPGAFLIGSAPGDPDASATEQPQRRVEIPAAFSIGVFQVLVSEYLAALGCLPGQEYASVPKAARFNFFRRQPAAPEKPVAQEPGKPVTRVSFDAAETLVRRLSEISGETYRLPSEAEWEYACRAGTRSRYSCGESIDASQAAFGLADGPLAPGAFRPNAFGLYDMHGNVREWTADRWHESYQSIPLDGTPDIEGHASMRVVRGGGWSDGAAMLRSAARMRATQASGADVIGLRVVRLLG